MNIPRNEYPRPQFVRDNWQNLNGEWQFEFDFGVSGKSRDMVNKPYSKVITVPFSPESKLSGIEYVDFIPAVWYRRTFNVDIDKNTSRIILHFGAVDYETEVFINGVSVGTHRGGYTPFEFDITKYVENGENTVVVYAIDDTRSPLQASGKQSTRYANAGCHYTRTTGIWQTVWTEVVPLSYIKNVKMTPDVDNECLHVHLTCAGNKAKKVKAEVSYKGEFVSSCECAVNGSNYADFTLEVKNPKLWNPGAPELYDIKFTLDDTDTLNSYFGMRKVEIDGFAIKINNKTVFQRLVLDQGFYPDGIITAPSDQALIDDIELSMAIGFNGARLHMKVFEPRFLYHADRHGYLVWDEYPTWGYDDKNPEILCRIIPEWLEVMNRDYSSPAVIGWCPYNETSDRRHPDTHTGVWLVTKNMDASRPVIDTSGYTHVNGFTDIFDVHDYEQDPEKYENQVGKTAFENDTIFKNRKTDIYNKDIPYFVSEFGGARWDVNKDRSNKPANAWGYGRDPESLEEFYARLKGLVDVIMDNPYICAFCYTQLTDVFQEVNGMYTFERGQKFDTATVNAILTRVAAIEELDK